jgi:hypothetical protein
MRTTRNPVPEMPLIPKGFLEFPKPKRRKKGKVDYAERLWNLSSIEYLLHGTGYRIDPEIY